MQMSDTKSQSFFLVHIDDDPLELRRVQRALKQQHATQIVFDVRSVCQVKDFFDILNQQKDIHLVLLDVHLNCEENGIGLVSVVKKKHPHAVIVMSSHCDDPLSVLKSLQAGADEFLSKTHALLHLPERLKAIYEKTRLKKGMASQTQCQNKNIAGKMMQKISARLPQMIQSAIQAIHLHGESGTGKEVVADLFRNACPLMPFVKINCGSLSPSLLESELFGYCKGAFTGAFTDKKGLIESASGGWLFLDEISCLSHQAQNALLRVLENQEVIRIGETKPRKIDVRFLSACNVSLPELVKQGAFRNDLWQRLKEVEIFLTPLRERKQEIPELIQFFCQTMSGGPYQIEQTAVGLLSQFSWKQGNVRQLRNCLRAMTEYQNDKILSPLCIPEDVLINESQQTEDKIPCTEAQKIPSHSIQVQIQDANQKWLSYAQIEKRVFQSIVEKTKGEKGKINTAQLAQQLQLARSTVQSKLKSFGP